MAAKDVSAHCDNQSDQNRVIGSATQCALSASQLVTCTKIVVSTLASSGDCQEQVADAARQVAGYVDNVVQVAQVSYVGGLCARVSFASDGCVVA